jgi:hypothetical protein
MKNEKISAKNSSANLIFGFEKEKCLTGTVPIRRTTKDDLIRSKSLWNNSILNSNSVDRHVNFLLNNLILKVLSLFIQKQKIVLIKSTWLLKSLQHNKKNT